MFSPFSDKADNKNYFSAASKPFFNASTGFSGKF
jgi:hypothetical protein